MGYQDYFSRLAAGLSLVLVLQGCLQQDELALSTQGQSEAVSNQPSSDLLSQSYSSREALISDARSKKASNSLYVDDTLALSGSGTAIRYRSTPAGDGVVYASGARVSAFPIVLTGSQLGGSYSSVAALVERARAVSFQSCITLDGSQIFAGTSPCLDLTSPAEVGGLADSTSNIVGEINVGGGPLQGNYASVQALLARAREISFNSCIIVNNVYVYVGFGPCLTAQTSTGGPSGPINAPNAPAGLPSAYTFVTRGANVYRVLDVCLQSDYSFKLRNVDASLNPKICGTTSDNHSACTAHPEIFRTLQQTGYTQVGGDFVNNGFAAARKRSLQLSQLPLQMDLFYIDDQRTSPQQIGSAKFHACAGRLTARSGFYCPRPGDADPCGTLYPGYTMVPGSCTEGLTAEFQCQPSFIETPQVTSASFPLYAEPSVNGPAPSPTPSSSPSPTPSVAPNAGCGSSAGQTFSSAPTSGLCAASYTPSSVTTNASSYTWTCNSGANLHSCVAQRSSSSGGEADPGIGTGLWVPSGTTNLVVADHSGPRNHPIVSYIPGCLNGLDAGTSQTGCAANTSYSAASLPNNVQVTVSMAMGKTLSLRFRPNLNAGTTVKSFKLQGPDGSSNLAGDVLIWLSTDPRTSYENAPAACKTTEDQNVFLYTGPGHCPVDPNVEIYYLNIRPNYSGAQRYVLTVNGSDFKR